MPIPIEPVQYAIRAVVCEWYGTDYLPVRVITRGQEIDEYEFRHQEVPPNLWEFVDHPARQLYMWRQHDPCVDIVIKREDKFHMIQDVCFKDAYPTAVEWWLAVKAILEDYKEDVWFVFHQ